MTHKWGHGHTDYVRCPRCKHGVMFDVTPRLAEAMGVKWVKCDRCEHQLAFKPTSTITGEP